MFLMLTMATGRLVLIWEETAPDSSSISSLREMSWMAPSSLQLASESSLELRRREESSWAWRVSSCLYSSFSLR